MHGSGVRDLGSSLSSDPIVWDLSTLPDIRPIRSGYSLKKFSRISGQISLGDTTPSISPEGFIMHMRGLKGLQNPPKKKSV